MLTSAVRQQVLARSKTGVCAASRLASTHVVGDVACCGQRPSAVASNWMGFAANNPYQPTMGVRVGLAARPHVHVVVWDHPNVPKLAHLHVAQWALLVPRHSHRAAAAQCIYPYCIYLPLRHWDPPNPAPRRLRNNLDPALLLQA